MPYKAVIFDLDGTLADTLDDIASAMNRVLHTRGYPVHTHRDYKYMVGRGLENLVTSALPETARVSQVMDSCLADLKEEYGRNCLVNTRLYNGIEILLMSLHEMHVKTSVFSNKAVDLTQKIINTLLPGHPFEIVVGAQQGLPKKPDPAGALLISERTGISPAETIYLGDSDVDMITANAAGMIAVGALWGFRTEVELRSNGARFVLKRPIDLIDFILET